MNLIKKLHQKKVPQLERKTPFRAKEVGKVTLGEQKKTLISGPLTGGATLPAVKIVSAAWKFQTTL